MAIQQYNTEDPRIGKWKGEILAHAMPVEVLGIAAMNKQMPKNSSDTVIYRRWLPSPGNVDNQWITTSNVDTYASQAQTVEGVTPNPDSLEAVDVQATLQQYHVLFGVTDRTVDLYEDDIPAEMKKQAGERVGLIKEMVMFGATKAGTNAYFAGGTSVATVDASVSLSGLRQIARDLRKNHGKPITSILAPSPNFNTAPVEASFLVFCHSDLEPDIRDLPGFIKVAEYGSRRPIHPMECGSVENFRFIVSPELAADADAGAASATLVSTTGTNADVYPMIVTAEDAYATVALRGMNSIDVTWLPPGQKDKDDPLGQRGYVGAKFYNTALILNQGWMAVYHVGASKLTA